MTDRKVRQRRLDRARRLGRFELFVAFAAMPLALFLLVAAPGSMGGGMMWEPPLIWSLMPWIGAGLYVVGVGWMIRIYRTDPEAGERSWRYHDL